MGRVASDWGPEVNPARVTLESRQHPEHDYIVAAERNPRCLIDASLAGRFCHAVATRDEINERPRGTNRDQDMRLYAFVSAGMRTGWPLLTREGEFDSLNRHECRRLVSGRCLPVSSSRSSYCHDVATATGTLSAAPDGSVRIARDPATKTISVVLIASSRTAHCRDDLAARRSGRSAACGGSSAIRGPWHLYRQMLYLRDPS